MTFRSGKDLRSVERSQISTGRLFFLCGRLFFLARPARDRKAPGNSIVSILPRNADATQREYARSPPPASRRPSNYSLKRTPASYPHDRSNHYALPIGHIKSKALTSPTNRYDHHIYFKHFYLLAHPINQSTKSSTNRQQPTNHESHRCFICPQHRRRCDCVWGR